MGMSSWLMRKISWWHGILIRRSKQNAANETLPGGRSVGVDGRFIGQRAEISSRNAVRLAAATARGKISFIGRRLKLELEKREHSLSRKSGTGNLEAIYRCRARSYCMWSMITA